MKLKYVIIVSLMLAILTIGAASASDDTISDDGNLTASPEDTIVESSVDEIELRANDAEDVVGDDAELITDYDYSVYVDDEYVMDRYVSVYGTLPKDASGTVKMTVGEHEDEYEVGYNEFYLSIHSSDLGIGLHNCNITYSGDDKYAGFEYLTEFRISSVAVNMPDEIVDSTYVEEIIRVNEDVTGQITINIDGNEHKNGSIEELKVHYDHDIYYIPMVLDYLSFGQHTYEIITTIDGEGTVTRAGSFNMSYKLELENTLDSVPYGKDFEITVSAPDDARSNISMVLNGNSFEHQLTGDETFITLTNLVFGANNLTLTYSDDKYPLKTVKYVLNVKGVIDYPEGRCDYDSDDAISLTLPNDARGNIVIYKKITDEDTGETQEQFVGAAQLENGHASYPVKNLGLGEHGLIVRYENGTYDVDDMECYVEIYPKITYSEGVMVDEEANFTVKFPDGADGNLIISIFECDEYGDRLDWEADPIELFNDQVTSDEIIINLDTSRKAFYKILIKYVEDDRELDNEYEEYVFNVYDRGSEWQLDADMPSEILQGEYLSVEINYPEGANGMVELYVDGNRVSTIGNVDNEDNDLDFAADFTIGTHNWEIRYRGDSYYEDSSQTGTFEITWVSVPEVLEIGGKTTVDVNINGGTGTVKLKIDGVDYDEQAIQDNKATFDLASLDQGVHTYEITYAGMSKSGSFNMSYAIDAQFGDDEFNDGIEFSKSNTMEVTLPDDATGTVTVSLNGATYSCDAGNGVAFVDIPLNWGENTLTIRFNGDDMYEAKEIQKTFTVDHAVVTINKVDGVFANASLYLPNDADGNLTISIWGEKVKTIQLENGEATIDGEGLPIGCYEISIRYDGEDYEVYSGDAYVSIEPEVNITGEISEGDDCIIDIDLPGSSGGLNIYVDDEFNQTLYFVDGKLHIAIPGLSLGEHTITFTYFGDEYINPFEAYDEDMDEFYRIPYNVEVKEKQIEAIDPGFNITIGNVEEGNPINIIVTAVKSFTSDVIVKIGENQVTISVINGTGSDNSLTFPAGDNYKATIDFDETDKFKAAHAEATFNVTVKTADANLEIIAGNVDLGNSATITVNINNRATGNITIKVTRQQDELVFGESTYNKTFHEAIEDGTATFKLTDLTQTGRYEITASYEGDGVVLSDTKTQQFRVLADANIEIIAVDEIEENETLTVTIKRNCVEGDSPSVSVSIPGLNNPQFRFIFGNNETATVTFDKLNHASTQIEVSFSSSNHFKDATVSKPIVITPHLLDPNLEIELPTGLNEGDDAVISITINETAYGTITVDVDGEIQTITALIYIGFGPGKHNVTFKSLSPGMKNVIVSYSGNYDPTKPEISNGTAIKYFAKSTKTGSFYIKPIPVSPGLDVTANEIYNGQNATITVAINNKTTGKVTINIGGEDKVIEMNEGKATFTTPALKTGEHKFTVSFEGDEYFLAESKNVTVKVKDNLRIEVVNDVNQFKNGYYTFKVVNDIDGSPASGVNVTLTTFGNIRAGFSATTDANGIASFRANKLYEFNNNGVNGSINLSIIDLDVGKHQVIVSVNDKTLTSNDLICNLTVTPANIKITINPYEEYYGSDKRLNITVTNVDGEALPGTVLNVLIPESRPDYYYVSTNENGTAQINASLLFKGTYDITVSNNDTVNIMNITVNGNFTIKPLDAKFSANASDIFVGENATIKVTVDEGFGGFVRIKIGEDLMDIPVSNGYGEYIITDLEADEYSYVVSYLGDKRYTEGNVTVTFKVNRKNPDFKIDIANVEENAMVVVKVTADKSFTGYVTVKVNGIDVLVAIVDGEGTNSTTGIVLPVKDGYAANLTFEGNDAFTAGSAETTFNVTAKPAPVLVDPALELIIANVEEGTPVTITVKTNATFTGQVKISSDVFNTTVDVKNGEGQTTANLTKGTYSFKAIFNATDAFKASEVTTSFNVTEKSSSGNGSGDNKTNTTVPVKIVANDLTVFYNDGKKYTVTVYGTDGKAAVKTQVVFKINGKKVGSAVTDAKGVATLKITQVPKTYKITTEALGASITKTLKVKQVLKLQKVKVKRSAKKLVIKVTLKQGKKALGKMKITLKFKGKKYVKKTNKKGVAKFTIKKSVLKKLKKGKKVTYSATYLKDTVKRTVKVKK
ncbi:MAG: Ig-like domain repeat protein [Methanobrevibacter sp.]|nr:Ig-like domain repeat protein [Methanobrevibacter sp.]